MKMKEFIEDPQGTVIHETCLSNHLLLVCFIYIFIVYFTVFRHNT